MDATQNSWQRLAHFRKDMRFGLLSMISYTYHPIFIIQKWSRLVLGESFQLPPCLTYLLSFYIQVTAPAVSTQSFYLHWGFYVRDCLAVSNAGLQSVWPFSRQSL
ncbi:hypothetical protein DPMN_113199 [Dreissena polymorpha]|uniref:Uncharacterized protein n=1 Tax=Dreissena polymorpha TaxID=45954 RepID=A0A9D4QRD2_DREPO|nr:hypothetical protein DPMN_113199 [Dreissena polymorpha]